MKKSNFLLFLIVLAAGAALLCAGGFFGKSAPKTVSGLMIGVGAAMVGVGIAKAVTEWVYLKNPSMRHKAEIDEKDERNEMIRCRSKAKAFDAAAVILPALMLVFILAGFGLAVVLLTVAAYLAIYAVELYYLFRYGTRM